MRDDEERFLFKAGGGRNIKKQKILFSVYPDLYLYGDDVLCRGVSFYERRFSGVFGGNMLQSMLGFGVFVIGIFSLIFLYYTNSFLIRRRQKEFGLYNILGMGKRNLVKILLWENVLTAAASIAAGLIFGILFSQACRDGGDEDPWRENRV